MTPRLGDVVLIGAAVWVAAALLTTSALSALFLGARRANARPRP